MGVPERIAQGCLHTGPLHALSFTYLQAPALDEAMKKFNTHNN
jgi:hypothetical protein